MPNEPISRPIASPLTSLIYLGAYEAARILGVGPRTVHRWVDAGSLPAHRTLGGHRRIRRDDLFAFAAERGIPLHPDAPRACPRILLVDDEPDLLQTLSDRIRHLLPEAEMHVTDSSFMAGLLAEKIRPHLILLDIRMPWADGIEVCRIIRKNPGTARARIVGVSAADTKAEIDGFLAAGGDDLLAKPVERETLRNLLSQVFPAARLAA